MLTHLVSMTPLSGQVNDGRGAALAPPVADAAAAPDSDASAANARLDRAARLLNGRPQKVATVPPTGGLTPRRAERIAAHIEANLASTVRAGQLADIAGLSTSHFFRAFKRSFGTTPRAYVARRRILLAQERILRTREPLAQIALDCGMCDQAHLTRLFRRAVGINPGAWRRQFALEAISVATSALSP
jgi:AraC family transcriptional regulator